ncbi:MAG: hypothetical protein HOL16_07040 [Alphaproteobacteria bacterium]|nr:hypothetical protein [Alphaproteobacteria bacterium]
MKIWEFRRQALQYTECFRFWIFIVCFVLVMVTCIGAQVGRANESQGQKWTAQAILDLKAGTQRNIGQVGLRMPLTQNNNSMLFTDFRFVADTKDEAEGNFGLGYRFIQGDWIYGGYGFFDRRKSQFGKYFSQITVGAEALSTTWEGRLNGYIPLSSRKLVNTTRVETGETRFIGFNQFISIADENTYDVPLGGGDAEVGYQLIEGLRFYGGGYHFVGKDAPSITGVRTRLTYDVTEWLRLEGDAQTDNIRNAVYFAGVRVTVPLGDVAKSKLTSVDRLMDRPIVRDVDIVVVKSNNKGEGILTKLPGEVLFLKEAENAVAPLDADGSAEKPLNPNAPSHSQKLADLKASGKFPHYVNLVVDRSRKPIQQFRAVVRKIQKKEKKKLVDAVGVVQAKLLRAKYEEKEDSHTLYVFKTARGNRSIVNKREVPKEKIGKFSVAADYSDGRVWEVRPKKRKKKQNIPGVRNNPRERVELRKKIRETTNGQKRAAMKYTEVVYLTGPSGEEIDRLKLKRGHRWKQVRKFVSRQALSGMVNR